MKNISKTFVVLAIATLANTAMAFDSFAFAGITSTGGSYSSSSSYSSTGQSQAQAQSQGIYNSGNSTNVNNTAVIVGDNGSISQTTTVNYGTVGSWGNWGTCNYGTQTRARACTTNTCAEALTDSRSCTVGNSNNANLDMITSSASSVDTDSAVLRGRVENENNIDVWFAFDKNDTTPSCSSSSNRVEVYGNKDNNQTFSKSVYGLNDNTTYYYRACGRNSDGNIVSGDRVSFRTDNNTNNANLDVVTKNATSVGRTSARLQGRLQNKDNVTTWFAFSRTDSTPECTDSSERIYVSNNTDDGDSFSKTVTGLRSNTTYYFRACGEDRNGNTERGSVKSFKTDRTNSSNNDREAVVETNSPTAITNYSAQLNGHVTVNDTADPRVHFVYGTASNRLNSKTTDLRVNRDTYFQAIQGLNTNTRYYYQAVVTDRNGNVIDRGIIRNFKTGRGTVVNNGPTAALTSSATPSFTVATLFGRVSNGDGLVRCYFEYGTTTSLGLRSTSYLVNSDSTSTCSRVISGLNPGTKYYYRTVIEDNGVAYRGVVKTFVQKRRGVVNTPTRTARVVTRTVSAPQAPVVVTPVSNVTVTLEDEVAQTVELQINKQVSQNRNFGYGTVVEAKAGDVVFYKVRVLNNTDKAMQDIVVTDTIPRGVELSGGSNYNGNAKFITSKIGNLSAGESRVFVTEMTVSSNVNNGDTINSSADVKFANETETTNSVRIDITDNQIAAATTDSRQSASILGSDSSFLPSTLIGWLGLIAFVLLIAFLISKLFATENGAKTTLAELRALEAAKMGR